MGTSPQRCGTPSGFRRHQKAGEKPCEACTAAKSEADKRWRAAPRVTQRNRASARAQHLALRDLSRLHHDEYSALYQQHKAALFAQLEDDFNPTGSTS
jgi:hypothetical protein